MRVIATKRLRDYAAEHGDAESALTFLEKIFENATWHNLRQVRKYRKDAGLVAVRSGRSLQAFNVHENLYRLIVHIHFDTQQIYIREFLTRDEYESGEWKHRNKELIDE
jgi:mRNA-degrading endonuclease HigB of HigAB toxin-antitoxin module